ncbi:actin-like ATPase domain-containing protein [Mollisia scopiformis]|uniref:Phosphotransferase n=1 Tax=Mollisia scopiformis TaxID=149040 RepID=A0A194X7T0_MOLSC|nr:actin-like ATPase domain-containing protein [Mollisia scopiformis]KUJ16226.1 actin-like ATPase domain-containing protein [Mollisia scopiformis]
MAATRESLDEFLRPLQVDIPTIHNLANKLCATYTALAAKSQDQFLPTPISDSVLRSSGEAKGRYLAIDIGGTNLRVGFIKLLGNESAETKNGFLVSELEVEEGSRVTRCLEKSWPIGEQLKNNNAEEFFNWIGKCIAEVVKSGCKEWPEEMRGTIPLGVTFSFPMIQHTLSDATIMDMGKGFVIPKGFDLGTNLCQSYDRARSPELPQVKMTAIANDTVSTLVSFTYQHGTNPRQRPAMGLICGTGCNATIPMSLNKLKASKRPSKVKVLDGSDDSDQELKIAVNTEWTIKGAAGPLHDLNLVTSWDKILSDENIPPGFQPFEFMTAGRYLGELGRIIILDYFTAHLRIPDSHLPSSLTQRYGLTTTFLGNLGPHLAVTEPSMIKQLQTELPSPDTSWQWSEELATIVYTIAKAIETRAAGLVAAAIIGLLGSADEIHLSLLENAVNGNGPPIIQHPDVDELLIGYTGGCIVHFQDYLEDCQNFLDGIMTAEFGDGEEVPRVALRPCHNGGIIGAGILAGTVQSVARDT